MERLKGKRALITGGTSGIGLETARHFLNEGARVAVTGTNPATLDAAAKELGQQALVLASDAGNVAAQRTLAQSVGEKFGQLDILVANAGIADLRPVDRWDEAGLDHSFGINFKGPFFLVQALLPWFANPASIVLTTSVNAHLGMPNTSIYGASKAALLSLARTFSGELIPRGIRVNAVSPGPIATPLYDKLGLTKADLQAVSDSLKSQTPAKRFGSPAEVAQAIVFLASDESAFTVGSELVIDGGMSNL
ncbi:MAG TPA: SDR family oxidoreductase [Bryobacteraceae bacterium]|nr:SDR family oxidoreductase [Bryobacteraceae bacterium]